MNIVVPSVGAQLSQLAREAHPNEPRSGLEFGHLVKSRIGHIPLLTKEGNLRQRRRGGGRSHAIDGMSGHPGSAFGASRPSFVRRGLSPWTLINYVLRPSAPCRRNVKFETYVRLYFWKTAKNWPKSRPLRGSFCDSNLTHGLQPWLRSKRRYAAESFF